MKRTIGFLAVFLFTPAMATLMSAETDYKDAIRQIEAVVESERRAFDVTGVVVALTDGQRIVHAKGYGEATLDSVFRAGSVSKLFNAIAVMKLVEDGKLDLDAPFGKYPGAVLPVNPFTDAPAITLRQMLSHRSGIQRESPIGGYLDESQASIRSTCESLRDCVVVTKPNAKTRYSNIVPTQAGRVVETLAEMPFEQYVKQQIFMPLGMDRSAWRARDLPDGALIPSRMIIANEGGGFRHERTPVFDLGTIPAGNLFTSALDLAKFIQFLDAKGNGPGGRVLSESSLSQMFTPQLDPNGAYGIGFALGKFREHKSVGHNGAVYGHSTALVYLPESRIGVVVIANEDNWNARVGKIVNHALSLMLEAKLKEANPPTPAPITLSNEKLAEFAGQFESQSFWAELTVKNGKLEGNYSFQPCQMIPTGEDAFLLNSRLHADAVVTFTRTEQKVTGFNLGLQRFSRVPARIEPIPQEWKRFLGSYGPWFIPVIVHEKYGHLYATTENLVDYRMTPFNRHVFRLPLGLYDDEYAVFQCQDDQTCIAVDFANMLLPRSNNP